MNGALAGIAAAAALALALGFLARRGRRMGLAQWTVAGRGFGTPLVFLLMAGEIYTTFTFLGGSGFAYGRGGPAYYILCYGTLAYVLSYFLLPPIWRYARDNELYSQSDFFVRKYDSPALGVLVALVGIVALVPYLVLQFKGLGIIVEAAGYGAIAAAPAIWIGAAVATAYVMVSGVRGSAWTAVAKDIMIVLVVVFLGIYFPLHEYGGIEPMFAAIEAGEARLHGAAGARRERVVVFFDRAPDHARLLYVAAHLRFDLYRAQRQDHQTQRRRAAALPIDPAVRVLRRLRRHPRGSGADRSERRPCLVQARGHDVRSLAGRHHRRGRRPHRAGARLDDPDDGRDAVRQQYLPPGRPLRRRRPRADGRETRGPGDRARRRRLHAAGRPDDRRAPA